MTTRPGLPEPRGDISAAVVAALRTALPGAVVFRDLPVESLDAFGEDAQLALWCCYALHYHGFAGVPDDWEWEPELLHLRARLERGFLARLHDECDAPAGAPLTTTAVLEELDALANGDGPSLSRQLEQQGTFAQAREFLVHRAVYQTKEADPHSWAIPRVEGAAKAAFVTIQHDEYGAGEPAEMHSQLFRTTLAWAGIDLDGLHRAGGTIVDRVPATTLATDNLVSCLGLHRSLRAACVGHLALFEMTSTGPMARYASLLRRLGAPTAARHFYETHVVADAVHEQVAREMVADLLRDDPDQADMVCFGARALDVVERRFASALIAAWSAGCSSLRADNGGEVSPPEGANRRGTPASTGARHAGSRTVAGARRPVATRR
jgi:hypothetical protein